MENIFQELIVDYYPPFSKDEISKHKLIFESIIPELIKVMVANDPLFSILYQRQFFEGNYFDNLNIDKPTRFRICLLLKLPVDVTAEMITLPGKQSAIIGITTTNYFLRKTLTKLGLLSKDKVMIWMKQLIQQSITIFNVPKGSGIWKIKFDYWLDVLIVTGYFGKIMEIELVPCFVFGPKMWPEGYIKNPVSWKPDFYISPKQPTYYSGNVTLDSQWCFSFQEQERELLSRNSNLKLNIKLLQVIKDRYKDKWIDDYFIKTVFLNIANSCIDLDQFTDNLQLYTDHLNTRSLSFFWSENHDNLLERVDPAVSCTTVQNLLNIRTNLWQNQTPKAVRRSILKHEWDFEVRKNLIILIGLTVFLLMAKGPILLLLTTLSCILYQIRSDIKRVLKKNTRIQQTKMLSTALFVFFISMDDYKDFCILFVLIFLGTILSEIYTSIKNLPRHIYYDKKVASTMLIATITSVFLGYPQYLEYFIIVPNLLIISHFIVNFMKNRNTFTKTLAITITSGIFITIPHLITAIFTVMCVIHLVRASLICRENFNKFHMIQICVSLILWCFGYTPKLLYLLISSFLLLIWNNFWCVLRQVFSDENILCLHVIVYSFHLKFGPFSLITCTLNCCISYLFMKIWQLFCIYTTDLLFEKYVIVAMALGSIDSILYDQCISYIL